LIFQKTKNKKLTKTNKILNMKQTTIYAALLFITLGVTMSACKKEDSPKPVEQELITTMRLLVTDSMGFNATFTYKVENGFGGTTQGTVRIDTVKLAPGKNYFVTTELYNEKVSPAENITTEVIAESNEHLFLYQSTPSMGAGSLTFFNGSVDSNGKPFCQTIALTTGAAGNGQLQVNLMHAPTDKNGTTPNASGGETDAEAIFPVRIQ